MDETNDVVPLSELSHGTNKRAPGYEITKKGPSAKAKRYRLTQPAYIHGRIWAIGDVMQWDGDPAPYMVPVDEDEEVPAKSAGRPRKEVTSKDVI